MRPQSCLILDSRQPDAYIWEMARYFINISEYRIILSWNPVYYILGQGNFSDFIDEFEYNLFFFNQGITVFHTNISKHLK